MFVHARERRSSNKATAGEGDDVDSALPSPEPTAAEPIPEVAISPGQSVET